MPQISVRCTVDNCYFWAPNNYCNAESILITSDAAARKYSEAVDVNQTEMIVSEIGETPASSCEETACKTFFRRS
ncbi:protein of unknown function DUF1540 [Sulfobacillus acidophilus DSM 10332]|uniref:DUF1540 domain-containing protein n=1 Tax=Sulfobacillus acidophilus (strain ATCC 700253 / DSM 10332 / NAL) TaxID=679936 RepID=G8TXY0_SULAD|nr:protein of unknown function DUF1540 [Sulfobacillus acidophilus DSM 10332]MCY0864643.1 DUF1540 domain-containing protein [Sulfobacillus sp.]